MDLTREVEKYILTDDFHTHTVFSHGKGEIEDNVNIAINKGLRSIAISDHGPGHLTYGVKRSNIPVMRAEIDRLQELHPEIKIYLSIEANIKTGFPYIDVKPEDVAQLDFLIAGYHYGTTRAHCIGNWMDAHHMMTETFGARLLIANTDATVKCIHTNELKILTHPGDKGRFDIEEISKACEETNTLMEINMKHPFLDVEGLRISAKRDVKFVISSDAHMPQNVGTFDRALMRALEAGIDPERIVNIEKK